MSISLDKDTKKTNLNHNNRTMNEAEWIKNDHIDKDRLYLNSYLVQEDLKELYKKEFGEAEKTFNKKQKRADRRIKNYYEHIQKSKRAAVQQEMILQVGDREDFKDNPEKWNMANEILEEWFIDFEKRNPNLKVYNAVIHNDESSPHLHINFVPVASKYERGMDKQVSFDRAILQQQDEKVWEAYQSLQAKKKEEAKVRKEKKIKGKYILTSAERKLDSPFGDWREKEVGVLEKLLNERGIERVKPGRNGFKDMNQFKMMTDELEAKTKEIEKLNRQLQEKKIQTAAELKRFEQTQNLNKEIEQPKKAEGFQPIIVPAGWEPVPEVGVQHKKGVFGERYEVDPKEIEYLRRWAIDQKDEKEKLEKGLKEEQHEQNTRNKQLLGIIDTQKKEVKQLVAVAITSERAQARQERQSDRDYILRLEDSLQDAGKRAEAFKKENAVLVRWKERALAVIDKIGVREHFDNAMKIFEKTSKQEKEK